MAHHRRTLETVEPLSKVHAWSGALLRGECMPVSGTRRRGISHGPRRRGRGGSPRVVFVSLHPMGPGQAASTHTTNIADEVRARGWSVRVIGVRLGSTHAGLSGRLARWATTIPRAIVALQTADVLYLRSHPIAFPLVAAARLIRVPIVVEVNGPDEDYFLAWPQLRHAPWVIHPAVRHQLRKASAIVAVTAGLARWAAERSPDRPTFVIPNGVDTSCFRPSAGPGLEQPPYVVYVGALAPWQGLAELLNAVRRPEWPTGVRLVIAGDGARRALVEDAARRQPERVTWLGHVAPHDIPDLVGNAIAAAVLSRDRHGTGVSPIKLYEAMAVGTPVLVADVEGAAETVADAQCGIVIPIDDPTALARTVARMAADPKAAHEMGLRGREAALAQHSWAARADATVTVLASVVDRAQGSQIIINHEVRGVPPSFLCQAAKAAVSGWRGWRAGS